MFVQRVCPLKSPFQCFFLDFREQSPESLNEALVKNQSDMLLFSKKARQVDFKPGTLKAYRDAKPSGYVELGKLQPDLQTAELVAKVNCAKSTTYACPFRIALTATPDTLEGCFVWNLGKDSPSSP